MKAVEICHLYISPGHNFVGHHGREPDAYPMIEVPMIECVAGLGIRDDRYFDFKNNYKGQITFFSLEVFDELCATLGLHDCSPASVLSHRGTGPFGETIASLPPARSLCGVRKRKPKSKL